MYKEFMSCFVQCWISALRRHREGLELTILLPPLCPYENAVITDVGKRNIIKLAQPTVDNFCASMSKSPSRKWTKFIGNTNTCGVFKVRSKRSVNIAGEPEAIMVGAVKSVWLQASPR